MRFFTEVDQTEVQKVLSNMYILVMYALIMFVIYYIANWPCILTLLVEKMQKETYVYHV